jgi:hypothetical protein
VGRVSRDFAAALAAARPWRGTRFLLPASGRVKPFSRKFSGARFFPVRRLLDALARQLGPPRSGRFEPGPEDRASIFAGREILQPSSGPGNPENMGSQLTRSRPGASVPRGAGRAQPSPRLRVRRGFLASSCPSARACRTIASINAIMSSSAGITW